MALTTEAGFGNTAPTRTTGAFGVIVFLASDVMLFSPFFAAYFLFRSTNDPWPVAGVHLDVTRAAVFTAVLVASSFTMHTADRAQERGDRRSMKVWLAATVLLGLAFLTNQLLEYATLDFRADDHAYGSVYWGLTGLHTLHVTAGICALGLLFVRAVRARRLDEVGSWRAGISLYWHLVDVIWVAVFLSVFVIQ